MATGMTRAGARLYAISVVSPFAGQAKRRSWKATTNHDGTVRPKGPGGVPV